MKNLILSLLFIAVNLLFINTQSIVPEWQRAQCEENCESKAFCRPGSSTYNDCMKRVNDCKAKCRLMK